MTTFKMQCPFFFPKAGNVNSMNLRVVFLSKAVTVIETFKSTVCRFAAYLLFMDIQNNSVCVSGGGGKGKGERLGLEVKVADTVKGCRKK